MTALPATAFKILTAEEWTAFQAEGRFEGSTADRKDGFIHLSAAEQVEGTLATHYAGRTGLILVEVDLDSLGDAVRWEESRGGALFPHLFDVLPLAAVIEARTLS